MNKYSIGGKIPLNNYRHLLKIMRVTLFFLFFSILFSQAANSFSQETEFTLHLKSTTIKEVCKELERKSDYRFIFAGNAKKTANKRVNINANSQGIKKILDELLSDTELAYRILDYQVVVYRDKNKKMKNKTEENVEEQETQQPAKKQITGKVVDAQGEPIIGANIVEIGTINGTVTSIDGKFELSVEDNASIHVSYIGYLEQSIATAGQSVFNITLLEDAKALEEVIVVGYGMQKKVNITGAVSSVNFNHTKIQSRAMNNISSALAGMSSGTVVRQTSGHPSENEASITLRGTGSLNMSSSPLVIVDGIIGNMSNVHPNDVESISILKDAASAAIYGSRASNGVILVTTKKGCNTGGKITFNYDGYYGMTAPTQWHDLITNTADHLTMVNLLETNSGFEAPYSEAYIEDYRQKSKTDPIGYPNTDFNQWYLDNTDNYLTNHNLSARGGNDKIAFSSSLNYQKNSGLVPNTGMEQYTFRNNLTYKVSDWLQIGNNISYLSRKEDYPRSSDIWPWAMSAWPGQVPKVIVGKDIDIPGQPEGKVLYGHDNVTGIVYGGNNPVYYAENMKGQRNTYWYTGRLSAVLTPLQDWNITMSYNIDRRKGDGFYYYGYAERWNFQTKTLVSTSNKNLTLSKHWDTTERRVFDLYSNYAKTLDNHNLNILVGYNQEEYINAWDNASREKMLSEDLHVFNAASGTPTVSGSGSDYAMKSFFGRINYDYKNKYLFEANLRRDGSSRFSPENRWGNFPSVSAAWRITEEDFWSVNKINDLKFRASYGQLGNAGIGNYEWQNFYIPANVAFGDSPASALNYSEIPNKNITWETTTVMNVGVDMLLLDKLSATFNYYNKYTDGILVREPIPLVNGGLGAPRVNSAEVSNKGYELELNYNTNFGDVSFNMGAMLSYNNNTIEKYKGDYKEPHGFGVWTEGQPIDKFYLRQVDYIVKEQSQVDELIAQGFTFLPSTPGVGDFMYKNTNGDKIIDDNDRVLMGNPLPKYTYNASVSLAYKGFDLYILMDGVAKWDRVMKGGIYELQHLTGTYVWPKAYFGKSWTENNRDAKIPKLYSNNGKNNVDSDFFMHSAAYMKIRTIQLGYQLPAFLNEKIRINKVRFYIDLENYFIFTKWPGQDPENSNPNPSKSELVHPCMKTMSFGVNLSF